MLLTILAAMAFQEWCSMFSIQFQGIQTDSEKWEHFSWNVKLNDYSFSYKTGLGHSTKSTTYGMRPKSIVKKTIRVDYKGEVLYAHVPKIKDVLYALFYNAAYGEISFDEFCDEYTCSNDSLKALGIYKTCSETAQKLKKIFGSKYYDYKQRICEWNY